MEHDISFEGVSLPVARHFFKKVCEIGSRHSEEHYAHELGLNSGGKAEVVGIIIPGEHLPEVFPKLQEKLIALTNGHQ